MSKVKKNDVSALNDLHKSRSEGGLVLHLTCGYYIINISSISPSLEEFLAEVKETLIFTKLNLDILYFYVHYTYWWTHPLVLDAPIARFAQTYVLRQSRLIMRLEVLQL